MNRYGRLWTAFIALLPASVALADKPPPLSPQTMQLPSGPASLKGLGESFSPNIATGSGSYSVPIDLPPGFLAPKVALSYSTGRGKTELGLGFTLPKFCIFRSTDKGLPNFSTNDRMSVQGTSFNDELVWVNTTDDLFRLRNEGGFALFERSHSEDLWRVHFASGEIAELGASWDARQATSQGTYRWCISRKRDRFGHEVAYDYLNEGGHIYLKEIQYQLHAPVDSQNRVAFEYEPRPDVYTDYTYGAADTTRLRLSRIEVWHGSRLVRTYHLSYENRELYSLLSAVQLVGEHGEEMPPLSFGYEQLEDTSSPVAMRWAPPIDGLLNGQATLDDVNGDSLPDVLVGDAQAYHYYENVDGGRWERWPRYVGNPPDRHLSSEVVVMTDVNGDGFRDVLHEHDGDFHYYPGGNIRDGKFVRYGPMRRMQGGIQGLHWGLPELKQVDLNKDGRTDLLMQGPENVQEILNDRGGRLKVREGPALPAGVQLTDPLLQFTDFNGDGHLDFVRKEISPERGWLRVWFGLGHGRYSDEKLLQDVPKGLNKEFHLQDVNRDGQADVVRISGTTVRYYLNNGRLGFTRGRGSYNNLPADYEALKILFADMNGNGTSDIVWITKKHKIVYLDLMANPNFGLLNRIDNGMGQVKTLTYRSSTEYMIEAKRAGEPWKTPMTSSMPVVSETTTTDSFDALGLAANVTRTTFTYRDGYYDGTEREFRGFAQVESISWGDDRHETQVTETHLHVGRNLETGADEEILKGRAHTQVLKNLEGEVYQSTETVWERNWLCQEDLEVEHGISRKLLPKCGPHREPTGTPWGGKDNHVAFAAQTGALVGAWERTSAPRWTYQESVHDLWGNVTTSTNFGEVEFLGSREIGDDFSQDQMNVLAGNDEAVQIASFINKADIGEWFVGVGYAQETRSIHGELLQQDRTYFDGADFEGLALGQLERGKVMRQEAWLKKADEPERWIETSRNAYNLHGQLTATVDANDNLREFAYDPETEMFLVEESVATEGEVLTYYADYDKAYGQVVRGIDLNEQVTRFVFDGLARLTKVIDPLGSVDQPLTWFHYEYGTPEYPVSTTRVEQLVDRVAGRYQTSWSYSDGTGRTRLSKTEAEAEHGYIGSGWQEFSPRGAATAVYQGFASQTHKFEAAPTFAPKTITELDALGRTRRTTPPPTADYGETFSLTEYLPFETHVFDEMDTREATWLYPAVTRIDGLGRAIEIIKHNDREGGSMGRTALTWGIGYDPLGNITSISDPQDLVRQYHYDSLKRLWRVDDPNAGVITYAHDDVGNTVLRIDAMGQEIHWQYGAANRLQQQHMRKSVHGFADTSYAFHYDTPGAALPDADFLKGQVSWVEMPSGEAYWSFDELGRAVTELQRISDPELPGLGFADFRQDAVYDPQGKVLHASLPEGFEVDYQYNPRSLLESLTGRRGSEGAPHGASFRYGPQGELLDKTFGNGLRSCLWYDIRQRLQATRTASTSTSCGVTDTDSSASIQHLRYNMTPEGLLARVEDHSAPRAALPRLDASYSYDKLYQLTDATLPQGSLSYAYDRIQNLIQRTTAFEGLGQNHLDTGDLIYGQGLAGPNAVTTAFGKRYSYNDAGELQTYNGFRLAFDVEGRLVAATKPDGTRLRWHYDFGGTRRLKISTLPGQQDKVYFYPFDGYQKRDGAPTWTLKAGDTVVGEVDYSPPKVPSLAAVDAIIDQATEDAEEDGSEPQDENLEVAIRRYWTNEPTDPPQERVRYYHPDHLSGPSHVTDADGNLLGFTQWYPYGTTAVEHGEQPNHTFTGAEREPEHQLGLIQMGARWFAPELGRWTTTDPLLLESPEAAIRRPLELNGYSYALNNPVNLVDPTGFAGEPSISAADVTLTYGTNAVELPTAIEAKLNEMLAASGNGSATISSTERNAQDQARIMLGNIKTDGVKSQKSLYGSSGDQVVDAYDKDKSDDENRTAMAAKLNDVGLCRVTNHCVRENKVAVDIEPSSLTDSSAFKTKVQGYVTDDDMVLKSIHPKKDRAHHIVFKKPTSAAANTDNGSGSADNPATAAGAAASETSDER